MVWWKTNKNANPATAEETTLNKWGVAVPTNPNEKFSNLPMDQFTSSKTDLKTTFVDEDEFEDIEVTKKKLGYKVAEKDEWIGPRTKGCLMQVGAGGVMGLCFGLISGMISGPLFAQKGHRFATSVRMMRTQSLFFGLIFGCGGFANCIRTYM